jgi:GTP-binding protein Era
MSATASKDQPHTGFCAILGLPNVGKSTLLNRVLGLKLVAVSPKPQTTRNRILGVNNLPDAQIVFVDTPGIQSGHNALRKYMHDEALSAAGDCDLALLVLDATDPRQRSPETLGRGAAGELAEALALVDVPVIGALNKVDRLRDKTTLLPIIEALDASERFAAIVPISAQHGTGVDDLVRVIADRLPLGPRLYPEDMYTDRPERFLAAELVREQLFLQLGDELPYASAVLIDSYEERGDRGDVVIGASVFVERESQKGIVVGKGGARIREVGQRARAEIGNLLGCPVHLKLHVKVDPEWSQGAGGIRRMGYE